MKSLLAFILLFLSVVAVRAQTAQRTTDSCAYFSNTSFGTVIRGGRGHDTLLIRNPLPFPVRVDSITVTPPFTLEHFYPPDSVWPGGRFCGAVDVITPDTASVDYDLYGTMCIYAYSDSADCVPNTQSIHIHVLAHDNTNAPLKISGSSYVQAHLDSRTDTRRFTILNDGGKAVHVDSVSFTNGKYWSVAGTSKMPKDLVGYDTMNVDVHFVAPVDGIYNDNIIIFTTNAVRHYAGLYYVVKAAAEIVDVGPTHASFQITPNPTTGEARFHLISAEAGKTWLTICDALGRILVQRSETLTSGENVLTFETASLPAGAYNCVLHGANMQASARLLIVR